MDHSLTRMLSMLLLFRCSASFRLCARIEEPPLSKNERTKQRKGEEDNKNKKTQPRTNVIYCVQ